jgi:hypothetical protein
MDRLRSHTGDVACFRLPDASEESVPGAKTQILGVRSQDLHVGAMVAAADRLSELVGGLEFFKQSPIAQFGSQMVPA